MAIRVTKIGNRYMATISPPEGRDWQSFLPVTLDELIKQANRAGVHVQDFWDAVGAADPSAVGRPRS